MKINTDLIVKLEETIDTIHPERGEIPIKILGFGEISLVFELVDDPEKVAYKRLPIFDNEKQVKRHINAYNEYNRILKEDIGLNVPDYGALWLKGPTGGIVLYCAQEKIPPESIGNRIIHELNNNDVKKLVLLVMRELKKVWAFNKDNVNINVGLDGQISNFSLLGYDPSNPKISENAKLLYVDTSTPMYRINEVEAMEAILFLKSAPSFIRWLLKALFLQEVMDRYYDWRLVTIDLIANFFKEQKPEIIPGLLKVVNKFFADEANEFNIEPITFEEVYSYYKNDKMIWVVFQAFRKFDRFLKTKLFRKKYDFYLPEKIER